MNAAAKSPIAELTQADLFEKISFICTAVNAVHNREELLDTSLRRTMELFGAIRGSIFICLEETDELVLKVAIGFKGDEAQTLVKRLGEGVVGKVAQLKKPIYVEDIAKDDRFEQKSEEAQANYRTSSFICAPLLIKDKLIGVINITDKQTGHRFTKDDMRLLDFLSSQIALNYRRIQLYERFKRVVKETQTLKDRLGQSDKEAEHLKKQIHIQEKLATIGKLAGGIAHEFNNPLDGVIRYTNLSIEHVRDDEVVRGYLMEIKKGLKRMANIVKNLLDCSRNELLTHSKVNFKDALDHSISSVQTDLDYKNINVEINMNQEIPPIRDLGLERVLSNLIRNAVDAIDRDGRITIGARCDQDHLTVSVSDTGHGIQASNMEQVFEPFYTTKDIDKGCGLGLTIVGEIIKIYDGKIAIESALNKGTTFTIKVPVE